MKNQTHLSVDIVHHCLSQDQAAWEQLHEWLTSFFERLGQKFFNLTEDECQEALQQTWVELLQNDCRALRAFSGRARLETYLTVIIRRVIADLRSKRSLNETFDNYSPKGELEDIEFQRADFWLSVERCLKPKDLLILRLISEGMSHSEIAELLSRSRGEMLTANAITVRIHRILSRLKKCLQSRDDPM